MGTDHALLNAVEAKQVAFVLRCYQWEWPSVSLGRFQNCRRTLKQSYTLSDVEALTIVRRFTGGRGILHGDDLTVSICSSFRLLSKSTLKEGYVGGRDIYAYFLPWFRSAFAALNTPVVSGEASRITQADPRGDCFDIISQADLVDAGTGVKRVGAAIHVSRCGFLLQASIPLGSPEKEQQREQLRRSIFSGASERRYAQTISADELVAALLATWTGFANSTEALPAKLACAADNLTEGIANSADTLRRNLYADPEWTARGQIPPGLIDSRGRL